MPFFSVIIPTYNRRERLRAAVDSVLAQTFRDFELIVVDDGSTDGTEGLLEGYGSSLRALRQANRGVSAARNAGISIASSPHIALLDSDDLWLPGKLEMQAAYIRDHPGILIHQCEETWIRNGRRVNPGRRHIKPEGMIFPQSLDLCLISPSSVVIRRDLLERTGLFDEALPACEDYDLWLRITLREKVGMLGKALVIKHGGHEDQLSRQFPAMDRFRVYSICRLLDTAGGAMPEEYREMARRAAVQKCRVLLKGARRRGKCALADALERIICSLEDEGGRPSGYGILADTASHP